MSTRIRRLIYIFKTLRHILEPYRLKQVFFALCQSLINYCIVSWGGASKTVLKKLEIAQRAILKICLFKKILFPTTELYKLCDVLTVRQLFILNLTIRQHIETKYDPKILSTRRGFVCKPNDRFYTAFSNRFFKCLGPLIYNKINKKLDIYPLTISKCKIITSTWLKSLTYDQTENLLQVNK